MREIKFLTVEETTLSGKDTVIHAVFLKNGIQQGASWFVPFSYPLRELIVDWVLKEQMPFPGRNAKTSIR